MLKSTMRVLHTLRSVAKLQMRCTSVLGATFQIDELQAAKKVARQIPDGGEPLNDVPNLYAP